MNDLISLSSLGSNWPTMDSGHVVEELATVLAEELDLDFVFVRAVHPVDDRVMELARSARFPEAVGSLNEIKAALASVLNASPAQTSVKVPHPFGSEHLTATAIPIVARQPTALLVAASYRPGFPNEHETLRLGVAAHHAAISIQRQEHERAFKSSQEHLRAVLDSAGDGIYVMGSDTRCTYLNPIGAAMLGYQADELLGRPLHDIIHHTHEDGSHHPVAECPIFLASQNGVSARVEDDVFWRKDGSPVPVTYSVSPIMVDGRASGAVVTYRDISERRLAESEQARLLRTVEAERQLLADVFHYAPSFMAVLSGRDHTFERVNEQYLDLIGHRDVLGQPVRAALPEVVDQGFVDLLDQVFSTGVAHRGTDVPVVLARQAGQIAEQRNVDFVFQPRRNPDGEVSGIFVQGIDLTERKLAEDNLARVSMESDRRRRLYETILANTPDLAYVFDLNHRFTYANEVLLKTWGRSWENAIGKTCLELGYQPWHAQLQDREIDLVKETKKPVRGQVPFEGTSGLRIHDYILVPVVGPNGDVEAIAGTTRDITELKESEDRTTALLAREQRRGELLSKVANASRSMGVVLSLDSIARILTEEAREMLGAHQAVTSLSVSDDWSQAINAVSLSEKYAAYRAYSPAPDGSGIYSEVCRTNSPMRLTQEELEAHPAWRGFGAHSKDHLAMRGWLAVPLIGHGGRNLGLVQLSDKYEGEFTEDDEAILVQLAAIASTGIENARLYEQVREQDRRKDEFLATLAHELRNPLAPIRTGLTLLKMAPTIEATTKTREVMERQVSHMVRLIDDLLDVSRITSGKVQLKKELVDVRTIFDAALELSRPLIDECGHQLFVSIPNYPMVLNADLTRLAQIVSNLLNNSAKYTPKGGRIDMSVLQTGVEAVICIRDNGLGLSAEALPQVFELFTQVGKTIDRAQGGLGIGLALVKKLVEMHDGRVTAQSDGLGKGCAFCIHLPLVLQLSVGGVETLEPSILESTAHRRILVVDDNIDAAELLSTLLRFGGHEVLMVHSGPAAIEAAKATPPDIVFLDIGLPGMNGYEVARHLRTAPETSDASLIALTGWGTDEDKRRTHEAGFDGHLTKPVQSDELHKLIQRFCAQQ